MGKVRVSITVDSSTITQYPGGAAMYRDEDGHQTYLPPALDLGIEPWYPREPSSGIAGLYLDGKLSLVGVEIDGLWDEMKWSDWYEYRTNEGYEVRGLTPGEKL